MVCQQCGVASDSGDNYCRGCGSAVRRPVVHLVKSGDASRLPLGVAPSTVWRGAAALALGTAAELLRRWVNRRLTAPAGQEPSLSPTSMLADLVERRLSPRERPSERDLVIEEELHVRYLRMGRRR